MNRAFGTIASTLLFASYAGCERVDLERMLDQNKAEPYEASPFFDDGRAMRSPPEGTVAKEALLGPEALVSGTNSGAYVARIPIVLDDKIMERGQTRFRIFCAACHGALGDGNSQVAENMNLRRPPSLHEARIAALPVGRVYRVVRDGYGLMPSYADQLDTSDRWAVVAYVKALQLSQKTTLAQLPPALVKEAQPWLK